MKNVMVAMRDGVIEQQGAPLDLYYSPANRFIAGFIGSPAMNFVPATVGEGGRSLILEFGTDRRILPVGQVLEPGRIVIAGIRPENIVVTEPGRGVFDVRVDVIESTGSSTFIAAATEPELTIVETARGNVHAGCDHGYALPDRDVFNKAAANRDWENIFAMFRRQLS